MNYTSIQLLITFSSIKTFFNIISLTHELIYLTKCLKGNTLPAWPPEATVLNKHYTFSPLA